MFSSLSTVLLFLDQNYFEYDLFVCEIPVLKLSLYNIWIVV